MSVSIVLALLVTLSLLPVANIEAAVPTATASKQVHYETISSSNEDRLTIIRKMHDPHGSPWKLQFAPDNSRLTTVSWDTSKEDPSESAWYGGSWNLSTGREQAIKLIPT